jgi:glycosyltransferase involved in cell wall biosynthesis
MTSAGGSQRRRVAVLMNHSQDPAGWAARHLDGETIDATPYGYGLAVEWFDLTWAQSHQESPRVRRWRIALSGRLGFDVVHAWRNRKVLFAADAVWTHTEVEHLAVSFLQRLVPRYRRTRVLAQTIWLWDRWPELGRARRRLYTWLLNSQAVECTHSPLNLAVSRATVPGRRVLLVPFGTKGLAALAAPPDGAASGWDVVAPGNDQHRDWPTLAEVARSRPHLKFWIAAGSANVRAVAWPENTHVAKVLDASAYATLLASAAVCVLALKPNLHASGMTTTLEATSVDTPVLVAGDGGLAAILGPGPCFVPSGDAAALALAIDQVVAGGATARASTPDVIARGLTQRDYVTRYALITDMLCGDRPWADHVSALSPQTRNPDPGDRPARMG